MKKFLTVVVMVGATTILGAGVASADSQIGQEPSKAACEQAVNSGKYNAQNQGGLYCKDDGSVWTTNRV